MSRNAFPNSISRLTAGAAVVALFGCQPAAEQHTFLERLGTDTLAVETFSRTADGFQGTLVTRMPTTQVTRYTATVTPEGRVVRMEAETMTPAENPEGPAATRQVITVDQDSATIERTGGDNPGTMRVAVPDGVIPVVPKTPVPYAMLDQAVRQALDSESPEYQVHFLAGNRVTPNTLIRHSDDRVAFDFFGNPMYLSVDMDGRVRGLSGVESTFKIETERVDEVALEQLAADFATRDARGEGIGRASPAATVEAQVGGANLGVEYSQPAKRGREIFGGLVPWNVVWRTGANAATHFTTDRDLMFGETRVPAGTYTLWSTFTPDGATLIINSQTRQWGTAYDPDQDFARVEMTSQTLSEPVERFTIGIEPTESGGVLHLSWDRSRYSAPFTVR